jgi:hypothetical protein
MYQELGGMRNPYRTAVKELQRCRAVRNPVHIRENRNKTIINVILMYGVDLSGSD